MQLLMETVCFLMKAQNMLYCFMCSTVNLDFHMAIALFFLFALCWLKGVCVCVLYSIGIGLKTLLLKVGKFT